MKKVKLIKVIISKNEINKLAVKDKKRFIMITRMLQDLNLLQKCLLYTSNEKPTKDHYIAANAILGCFFLKTLISKTHEMWTFLNENNILKDYLSFSDELKQKTDKIIEFFNKKGVKEIFAFVRDKFGFHYEYWSDIDEKIDKAINDLEHFETWLSSEDSGNEIFASSNVVIWKVISSEMLKIGFIGNENELFGKLFDISLEGACLFREFCVSYLGNNFPITWKQIDEIETEATLMSEVQLPLIVTK